MMWRTSTTIPGRSIWATIFRGILAINRLFAIFCLFFVPHRISDRISKLIFTGISPSRNCLPNKFLKLIVQLVFVFKGFGNSMCSMLMYWLWRFRLLGFWCFLWCGYQSVVTKRRVLFGILFTILSRKITFNNTFILLKLSRVGI